MLAVMSGKGGVGKSAVTSLLAVSLRRQGYEVGILDADITGPSIPRLFGLYDRPEKYKEFITPARTLDGMKIMSLNLFVAAEDDPVLWRGPILSNAVMQFWTDVAWGNLDFLLIDLPPGTGDIPMTILQRLPLQGVLVVTTPQDLAGMIVGKSIKMVQKSRVPILGLIENMSYISCPCCGEMIKLFGNNAKRRAERSGIPLLASLPVDPDLVQSGDLGRIEEYEGPAAKALQPVVSLLASMVGEKTAVS